MLRKLFFSALLLLIAASLARAGDTADTAWTRQTLGEDIYDVKFSPDGNTVASAHNKGNIRLWNAATGEIIKTLQTKAISVQSIAFTSDGKYLFTGTDESGLFKWDLNTYQVSNIFLNIPNANTILSMCITNDNTKLFIGGAVSDSTNLINTLCVVESSTGKIIKTLDSNKTYLKVILSQDNNYLATYAQYTNNGIKYQLTIWNALTFQKIKTLDDTKDEITDIAFSYDGTKLYDTQGNIGYMNIFSIPSGILLKKINTVSLPINGGIFGIIPLKSINKCFISYITLQPKGKYSIFNFDNNILEYSYNNIMGGTKLLSISTNESKIAAGDSYIISVLNNTFTDIINNVKNDQYSVIPNPLKNSAIIKFYIPFSGNTKLLLYNNTGSLIEKLFENNLESCNNILELNIPKLQNGIYFIIIQAKYFNKSLKFSIVK